MCIETPIAIKTKTNLMTGLSTANAIVAPIVIHSRVIVRAFTFSGTSLLSR